jgi:hypothetical protein
MATSDPRWQITGGYIENCSCDVVCPCLFSPAPANVPTQGACEVALGFHVDAGRYGDVSLDGLNAAVAFRTPGPMQDGDWTAAFYVDERGNDAQRDALEAIVSGKAGGIIGDLMSMVSTVLGVAVVPITWHAEDRRRSMEIPGRMHVGVTATPGNDPDDAIWARNAHPFAPEVAMAIGTEARTWTDYGRHWDNSGKNGHYAPIDWTNA